jgi:phosphoglycolate phosphatase
LSQSTTPHILFDFDGTLVDSAPGILESMRGAFSRTGIEPRIALTELLIGVPLRAVLVQALGADDVVQVERLEAAFRDDYDERGYRGTRSYPGIPAALEALRAAGRRLHIVTNKRMVPTRLILKELNWLPLFDTVHTLDTCPGLQRKSEVVTQLLQVIRVPGASFVMIGDTVDDAEAAHNNGLPFAWVRWGYGRDIDIGLRGRSVHSANEMLQHLLDLDPASGTGT